MRFSKARLTSYAKPPDYSVPLGQIFFPTLRAKKISKPEQSKFLAINKNDHALAWRIALIEQAQHSIDAQYYSWHSDISGQWLISQLITAADRGVRVRLLLDDIHTLGTDRRLATLNRHKNIEVRIFNPFKIRWQNSLLRVVELLWSLKRLNHRMHNKVLIADNVLAIIGGRNIGDEFFGLNPSLEFRDLDLMLSGNAVDRLSFSFDLFWNNPLTKTARRLIAFRPGMLDFRLMKKRLEKNQISSSAMLQRINNLKSTLLTNPDLQSQLVTSSAEVFYDLPHIEDNNKMLMANALYQHNLQTKKELTIISAYFIPSKTLISSLQTLIKNGVRIRVLTNSLASIDVTAAFTGYECYRLQLLRMGIELYEFRAKPTYQNATHSKPAFLSLHAKSIIYDNDSVYVGSLNLDPRSECLNTEIGLFVNSAKLSQSIYQTFMHKLNKGDYWQVKIDPHGDLFWQHGDNIINTEPSRGLWQRISKNLYSLLPIHRHL